MPLDTSQQASYALTVILAVIGGLLACLAEVGKRFNFLNATNTKWVYRLSYLFMGLSVLVFVLRGLA
jgi:hypothetical protein